ncbi:MAG TPA: VOC family protein [Thermoplasmata archaeon]|nr:VOC family protein [Thermoplasmata archaeon]HLE53932.1 VOC family protein [Thermoplasmata archaeon]
MAEQDVETNGRATRVWVASVHVSDLERAIRFYRDVLGLPVVLDGRPGNAWVELGPEEPLCKVGLNGDGTAPPKIGGVAPTGIVFDTDDMQAFAARLRKAGVTFTHEPVRQPWGGWVADFLDPDGNELEVVYHPDHYGTRGT